MTSITRLFESKKVCATLFILLLLSVLVNSFAGGSLPSFGSSPVLAPDAQQELRADGTEFPPDFDWGPKNLRADGTEFPPDIDWGPNNFWAHGTEFLPDFDW